MKTRGKLLIIGFLLVGIMLVGGMGWIRYTIIEENSIYLGEPL